MDELCFLSLLKNPENILRFFGFVFCGRLRVERFGFGLIVDELSDGVDGSFNNLLKWDKELINLSNNSSVVFGALLFFDFAVFWIYN